MAVVKLVWATPDAEKYLAYMARVSNPTATRDQPFARLLKYLVRKKHWSPFDMVNMCVEINDCPRDVSRQMLRHHSLKFQEFSGRYAEYEKLLEPREARMQDKDNRQNSLPCEDEKLEKWWAVTQDLVSVTVLGFYQKALKYGIAKEVARAILPEGLVPSKVHVNGTVRSWIHYFEVRCDPATQKEHRIVAEQIRDVFYETFPELKEILNNDVQSSS